MITAATPIAIPSIDSTERSGCPIIAPEDRRIRSAKSILTMSVFLSAKANGSPGLHQDQAA